MVLNGISFKDSVCSCNTCVDMCKHRPCWGTPGEIKNIISKGFSKKLMVDFWCRSGGDILILCGAIKGYEKRYAPSWPSGVFIFN